MSEDPEAPDAEAPDSPTPSPDGSSSEETPVPSEPEGSQTADPYEQRYKDTQAAYTQSQQEISQWRDVVARAQRGEPEAIKALGLSIAEADEGDDEYLDPDERIDQLEQRLAERDAEAERQREEAELETLENQYLSEEVGKLEKDHGKLSKAERTIVEKFAKANRTDEGFPDVTGAFETFVAAADARREAYIASKKAPGVLKGSAGTEAIDTSTDEARQKAMLETMAAEASN